VIQLISCNSSETKYKITCHSCFTTATRRFAFLFSPTHPQEPALGQHKSNSDLARSSAPSSFQPRKAIGQFRQHLIIPPATSAFNRRIAPHHPTPRPSCPLQPPQTTVNKPPEHPHKSHNELLLLLLLLILHLNRPQLPTQQSPTSNHTRRRERRPRQRRLFTHLQRPARLLHRKRPPLPSLAPPRPKSTPSRTSPRPRNLLPIPGPRSRPRHRRLRPKQWRRPR
jgi:hypothetical protein